MFIAVGFPTSSREEGAELLYLGLSRGDMISACESAVESKKFQRIGKLFRPIFQKHSLAAPVHLVTDCSAEHNAGLRVERLSIQCGSSSEEAAANGAVSKLDACKATVIRRQGAADAAVAKLQSFPTVMTPQQKAFHATAVLQSEKAQSDLEAAKTALTAAEADFAVKQKLFEDLPKPASAVPVETEAVPSDTAPKTKKKK